MSSICKNLLLEEELDLIRNAVSGVHQAAGPGSSLQDYRNALADAFERKGIPYIIKVHSNVTSETVKGYAPVFICFGAIAVDLRAAERIGRAHRTGLRRYLQTAGLKIGLLLNVMDGTKSAIERINP